MTKIVKIFENMDSLCCRDFDVEQTLLLLHYPTPNVFWSWGVERKINYDDKGLLLKVNAHRHSGWILISLSVADLFDVYLFEDGKVKDEIKGLYFDQLLKGIDNRIEFIEGYEY